MLIRSQKSFWDLFGTQLGPFGSYNTVQNCYYVIEKRGVKIKEVKKLKKIIDDGCNSKLIKGSEFDLPLGIPIIHKPKKIVIPDILVPFSHRDSVKVKKKAAICFNEYDRNFEAVLKNPEIYVEDFKRFLAIISPDCSLYRDAPLVNQLQNINRNRTIGSFYENNGIYVIPQIRWGTEKTFDTSYFPERVAFLGVEKHSIVAIGPYGCIRGKENEEYFRSGLEAMLIQLEPSVVLVYGNSHHILDEYRNETKFIEYPDWTTFKHQLSNKKGVK